LSRDVKMRWKWTNETLDINGKVYAEKSTALHIIYY
jgi:hypothetical protein